MVAALLRRELALAARDPGLRYALLGFLVALLFVALPTAIGALAREPAGPEALGAWLTGRLTTADRVLACALAPWAMLRIGGPERGGALVRLVLESRCRPRTVVLVRAAVGYLFLLQLLVVSLPVLLLAATVSSASPLAVLAAVGDLALFLALVGAAVLPWSLERRPTLVPLALAYLVLLVLAAGHWSVLEAAGPAAAAAVTGAAALALGWWQIRRSSSRLLCLRHGPPR